MWSLLLTSLVIKEGFGFDKVIEKIYLKKKAQGLRKRQNKR